MKESSSGWKWFWIAVMFIFTSPFIFFGVIDIQNTIRFNACVEAGGSYTQEAPTIAQCDLTDVGK